MVQFITILLVGIVAVLAPSYAYPVEVAIEPGPRGPSQTRYVCVIVL
jgi:hypothetical protein